MTGNHPRKFFALADLYIKIAIPSRFETRLRVKLACANLSKSVCAFQLRNVGFVALRLGLLLWALILFPSFLHADFEVADLKIDGQALNVAFKDMEGKGKNNLVIALRRHVKSGAAKKFIVVASLNGDQGTPQTSIAREMEIPDDVIAYGLGDFLGEGRPQVVFFTGDAAVALNAQGAPKTVLSGQRFFFNAPLSDDLPRWNYIRDLNGDGRDDLVLADARGYVVYLQNANHELIRSGRAEGDFKFATPVVELPGDDSAAQADVNIETTANSSELSGTPRSVIRSGGWESAAPPIQTSRKIGRLIFADANADRKPDLLLMKKDKLLAYFQSADGRFAEKPDLSIPLGPQGAKRAWDESRLPIANADANGDGRVDFVVSEVDAKDLATKLRVYFWGENGIPAEPNQVIKLSGLGETAQLLDVNGDGFPDLGIATFRADKMLALKKPEVEEIDGTYYVYLFDPKTGQFSRRPDIKHEYTVAVTADIGQDQAREFASFEGDFNGDGVRDLMIFANKGELAVHLGSVGKNDKMKFSVDSRPSIRQAIQVPLHIWIVDLDRDDKSDVVLQFKDHLQILRLR